MNDLVLELFWTGVRFPCTPPFTIEEQMPKKRLSPTKYRKSFTKQWKQRIADDIYDAQLEDLEHLLAKKRRLKRKELFTYGTSK